MRITVMALAVTVKAMTMTGRSPTMTRTVGSSSMSAGWPSASGRAPIVARAATSRAAYDHDGQVVVVRPWRADVARLRPAASAERVYDLDAAVVPAVAEVLGQDVYNPSRGMPQ
jgi:hypothetical protein